MQVLGANGAGGDCSFASVIITNGRPIYLKIFLVSHVLSSADNLLTYPSLSLVLPPNHLFSTPIWSFYNQFILSPVYYEGLQDKLVQVKDARAALDALRDEHREKLRREAEMAERQRQHQMAQKLDIMRKKKQEYLQVQSYSI